MWNESLSVSFVNLVNITATTPEISNFCYRVYFFGAPASTYKHANKSMLRCYNSFQ